MVIERILLLGGGDGSVQAIGAMNNKQKCIGILDDNRDMYGKTILGVKIVGVFDDIGDLKNKFDFIVISFSGDIKIRRDIFNKLKRDFEFTNIIGSNVIVGSEVDFGTGNLIVGYSRINSFTKVGDNNFLSSYVNIEHHNTLGSHCTFGPMVTTSGRVDIGDMVRFGTGIFIEPFLKIGDESIISSGCTITKNISNKSVVKRKIGYIIRDL